MSVHLFVEGGGPYDERQKECRKAFRLFLEKLLGERPQPRISACGSRDEAYKDFCLSIKNYPDTLAVLLVDSEGPVPAGKTPAAHLRDPSKWTKRVPAERLYLMVQCMESWFLADPPVVEAFYGKEFKTDALPPNPNIEAIPVTHVSQGLRQATRKTANGAYHKTQHGFKILALIDPAKVRDRCPHAKAFFDYLLSQLT